ncbi:L,D-transpeptidase family protein [Streptomyces fractus]|uniref:L,D-transpeptidase family protein n=1 Tax=Streptomyces fractus TaxID=641806 RepID=UPI003CFADCE5
MIRLTRRGRAVLLFVVVLALVAAVLGAQQLRTPPTSAGDSVTTHSTIPGLGPKTLAEIPSDATHVVVSTGESMDSNVTDTVLWSKNTTTGDWTPSHTMAGHNAEDGWTTDHTEGDLRSPIGVYSITDVGGSDPAPSGTELPYTQSDDFAASGTGFDGESLADVFDYVIAINYNRVPGTSPLDDQRPEGQEKGGGIWLHVDHGGGTHGCVAVSANDMVYLLQHLDPADHPVIVMGPDSSLAE